MTGVEGVPGGARGRAAAAHRLVLEFAFDGWYEVLAWTRVALVVGTSIVLLASTNVPPWAWAAAAAASVGAVLAVGHARWEFLDDSSSPGLVPGWLTVWLQRLMPRSGKFRADLSGTCEGLGGFAVVLTVLGPFALDLPHTSRLVLASCAVLFMASAATNWMMDPSWYRPESVALRWLRWLLGPGVATFAFCLVTWFTPDLEHSAAFGVAAAAPFLGVTLAAIGEDLLVGKALDLADRTATLTRADVSVDMHGRVKQPAVLLGEWMKVAGVSDANVLASHRQLLVSVERVRRSLAAEAGDTGTLTEAFEALRVLEQMTGRNLALSATSRAQVVRDTTLTQVVNDLVINAAQSGRGTVSATVALEDELEQPLPKPDAAATVSDGVRPIRIRVRVTDEGSGPDRETWLSNETHSSSQLARRLRRLGGDLMMVHDQAGGFLGVDAYWELADT